MLHNLDLLSTQIRMLRKRIKTIDKIETREAADKLVEIRDKRPGRNFGGGTFGK